MKFSKGYIHGGYRRSDGRAAINLVLPTLFTTYSKYMLRHLAPLISGSCILETMHASHHMTPPESLQSSRNPFVRLQQPSIVQVGPKQGGIYVCI